MKKSIYLKCTLTVVLSCLFSFASAKDLFLSTSGDDSNSGLSAGLPVLTFNKAYTLAVSGDVINVSGMIDISNDPGLNMGSGTTSGIKAGYTISKNISILGTTAATDGFDGKNLTRIFYPTGGSFTVNFKNLTLTNGRYNLTGKDSGGALSILYSTVNCENVIFDNNTTIDATNNSNGGAVIIQNTKGVTFKNCVFSNNVGQSGGAMRIYDIGNLNAIVRIEGCSFVNNTSASGGSALWIRMGGTALNTRVDIVNSTFSNNSSSNGAIFVYSTADTTPTINLTNCTVTGNRGTANGPSGISVFSGFLGKLNINNSIIEGNYGGANGVLPYWDLKFEAAPTTAKLMINNSIIGRNSGVTIPTSCYPGLDAAPVTNYFNNNNIASSSSNLISNLEAFNATNNSYPLLPTSPAINLGDAAYLSVQGISKDQVGTSRFFLNNKCDAGAFEYQGTRVYISSTSTTPDSNPISVSINFSRAVTGFTVDDLRVGNGAASNFIPVNGTTYTVDIIPVTKGNVTVDIASAVAIDASANANAVAQQFVFYFNNTNSVTLSSISPLNNKPLYYGSQIAWVSPISGSFNVYIGENQDDVLNAGILSEFFRGNVSTSFFDISPLKLKSGTKYYWRIDVVNEGVAKTGDVNAFINPINSANYHTLRSGLRNSLLKFQNQKTGRVAFLGGSITYNGGWRDSICSYLQAQFPTTTFDFISAGIPSMGSTPAAFRMEKDVLSKGKIDLLFEEAAVNDGPSGNSFSKTEQIRAMEGIVRHAITANPEMDIVFMYFVDPSSISDYNNQKDPDVIINHDLVAQTYAIPAINLAKEVNDRINFGEFTWAEDFQNLHPSPFGQGIYFRSMRCFLDSVWKNPIELNEVMVSKILPSKIDPDCYDTGCLVDISKAESSANWVLNPNWTPTDGKGTRADYTNVPMLIGETPDAILTFNFNGKAVGISTASGPDAGIVISSVDGEPWKTTDLFTIASAALHCPWYFTLYSTLAEGNHTLQLKLATTKNASSVGTSCRIRYFFVSGAQIPTTINSTVKDNLINIYSPSKGVLSIQANSDYPFSYTIYDRTGVLLAKKSKCINNDNIRLPEKGIYFVEVSLNKLRFVEKIVLI